MRNWSKIAGRILGKISAGVGPLCRLLEKAVVGLGSRDGARWKAEAWGFLLVPNRVL